MSEKTIQSSSNDKLSLLLRSSRNGNLDDVLERLNQGDSPEIANPENHAFPLLYAAQNGHTKIVDALIGAKAVVNRLTPFTGGFPLLVAAQNGHAEIVNSLLNAGASVNLVNPENGTFPLLMAAQNGHAEIVNSLLNAGASLNLVNPESGTFPLLMAALNGHSEIVTALLNAGAAVDMVNPMSGTFPLLMAAQNGHSEVVTALLNAGAAVDMVSPMSGTFPLLTAAQNGHSEIVTALLNTGAAVDMVTPSGTFPLLTAAQNGHSEIVTELLDAGAAVDMVDPMRGTFPLLMAVQNGHSEIVTALLNTGADPDRAHVTTGLTPVDIALMDGKQDIIGMFGTALGTSTDELVVRSKSRIEEGSDKLANFNSDQVDARVTIAMAQLTLLDDWPVPPALPIRWSRPDKDGSRRALASLVTLQLTGQIPEARALDIRSADLSFYPGCTLFDIAVPHDDRIVALSVLYVSDGVFVHLDGTSPPIHALNARADGPLDLAEPKMAEDYLRFFCAYVAGEDGPFRIVDSAAEVVLQSDDEEQINKLGELVVPVAFQRMEGKGFRFNATVVYADALFRAKFEVAHTGMIELTEDEPLAQDLSVPRHEFKDGWRQVNFLLTVAGGHSASL